MGVYRAIRYTPIMTNILKIEIFRGMNSMIDGE